MAQFLWGASGLLISTGMWAWVLRRYDRLEPEPIKVLLRVGLVGGLMSIIPAIIGNSLADHFLGLDGFVNDLSRRIITPGAGLGHFHRYQRRNLEVPGHAPPGKETAGIRPTD